MIAKNVAATVSLVLVYSFQALAQQPPAYKAPFFADAGRVSKVMATKSVIEKLYVDYAATNHLPGFVFGVMVDGKLVYTGNTGFTDLPKKSPATTKSAFRIASMSKSFTAMAILRLRDEGRLRLDDPASNYIPEMKKLHYLSSDAAPITIRNLMTHSAGFPEDNPWGDRQLADTDRELLQLVDKGLSFSSVPGVQYEYSNLGFALLGRIISVVSGKPYQQYITENIWKPLGMDHTYWEYTRVPAGELALGYRWINGQWREEALLHDGSYGAMGGIITTIEDFAKYMALQLSAWPPRNDAESMVIKRSSLREMQQPWRFNNLNAQYRYPGTNTVSPLVSAYGYGLRWTQDSRGRTTVGHSGGLPGFGSNWLILPDYGIGLVCFANRTYAPTSVINMQVMDTLLALTGIQPRVIPPSSILEQRKNELVKILPAWTNAERSGIFAENFFPDYPIDSLRSEATLLFASAGKILRVGELLPENQLRGSFIMEGEKANLQVSFTLTPEMPALIQEYHIREIRK
jgi:CubicO group peptidase (beta-lactamase class C family)